VKYYNHITGQEKLAIQGILDGKTNTTIADELHISKHTITKHISNVFQKLKIKSRHELMGLMQGKS
jgi:two-component system response regulator DegU